VGKKKKKPERTIFFTLSVLESKEISSQTSTQIQIAKRAQEKGTGRVEPQKTTLSISKTRETSPTSDSQARDKARADISIVWIFL